MARIVIAVVFLCLGVVPAQAQDFPLTVIRMGTDLYEVTKEDLCIQTQYCFEVEDQAEVILRLENSGNKLLFKTAAAFCDIVMIYGRSQLKTGLYSMTLTRIGDNWYQIDGKDAALKTSGCLSLAESSEGRLDMKNEEQGTLELSQFDEVCDVVGVYAKAELTIVQKQE